MAKNHMLIIFIAAGLVLAVVLGAYFYRSNLGPSQGEFVSLLNEFVEKIAAGDFDGARELMTEETRGMLREPGTVLGETVYHKLKLKSIDSFYEKTNSVIRIAPYIREPPRPRKGAIRASSRSQCRHFVLPSLSRHFQFD